MASLTGATALITLTIPGLFSSPQQLQGFAADDIYDVDQQVITETLMGVDGILSGGFVLVAVKQNITLQSDSASNAIFEQWAAIQRQNRDSLTANGYTALKALGRAYRSTKGFLTDYPPVPSVGKLIKPRKYSITWESVLAVPI